MPISLTFQTQLKNLIDACSEYEGRYYLLYLYESLINSPKPAAQTDEIARHLIALISNINKIKEIDLSGNERLKQVEKIIENYNALVSATGANGVLYKAKGALLSLGGMIVGLFIGAFGATFGAVTFGLNDLLHFKLPTGIVVGAFTGLLTGLIIGKRIPSKLLKEEEARKIHYLVNKLDTTFDSLFDSVQTDCLENVKHEVLHKNFDGNTEAFTAFLNNTHQYEILGTEALFFSSKLKGSIEHHSFIKFKINEEAKLIEFGLPSDEETEFSQRETRKTTGEQLLSMLAMHRLLQPQYEVSFNNMYGLAQRYEPGVDDCQTYVDKILTSVGEPISKLTHFTPQDTAIGRFVDKAINFFRPIPEKLSDCNLKISSECTNKSPAVSMS